MELQGNMERYLTSKGCSHFAGMRALPLAKPWDVGDKHQLPLVKRVDEELSAFLLLHHTPDGIMLVDLDTSIRYVNPAFEKLTGFPVIELVGRKAPYPWWAGRTPCQNSNSTRHMCREFKRCESLLRKKNGEQLWVEIDSVPIKSDGQIRYYLSRWLDVTDQKKLKDNMEAYAREVTRIHEEQRKHIARKLHEEIAQSLAALCLDIGAISKAAEQKSDEVAPVLKELRARIVAVTNDICYLSYQLRPAELDILGLVPALETLVAGLNDKGISAQLVVTGVMRPVSPDIELSQFRIVQEALSNIGERADATKVIVRVRYSSKKIKVAILDNGTGFELPAPSGNFASRGKLGLINMEERVRLCGGTFSIKSRPGKGKGVYLAFAETAERPVAMVKRLETRVFEFYKHKYRNLSELARAMGISVSEIYRVRQGKRPISEKFIIGATRAFPGYRLDSLFCVPRGEPK